MRGRRAVAVGLAVGLAAAGCGPTTHPDRGVAFIVVDSAASFVREMTEGFTVGVREVGGVTHAESGPDIGDAAAQLVMFQGYRKTHPDGLSVFTLSPELMAAPMSQAVRAGIPVIAVDCPPAPGSDVSLFVGNDNYQLGRMLADEAADKLPTRATGLVVLGSAVPGAPVLDQRTVGIRDELHRRLPGIQVLGPFDTKQDGAANEAAWTVLIKANPRALAFLGTGDADGQNLTTIRARTHAGWVAGAFGLNTVALEAVRDGDLVLVSPEHFLQGAVAGRFQAAHARTGAALPRGWIVIPGLAVNARNVDAIRARQAWLGTRENWFANQINDIAAHPARYLRPMDTSH